MTWSRRGLALVLVVVLIATPPGTLWAAVAVDATMTGGNSSDGDSQQGDNVTSISSTGITVGASASCLVMMAVWSAMPVGEAVTATWNGVTMTQRARATAVVGATITAGIWTLVSPASGAQTLEATWTNTADVYMSAISFTGTDTTTCVEVADSATATLTNALTITSTTDGATVATSGKNSSDPTMNQTAIWANSPFDPGGGGSYALGGTSNEHTFDFAGGDSQAIAGVHVISGAAPAAVVVPMRTMTGVGR